MLQCTFSSSTLLRTPLITKAGQQKSRGGGGWKMRGGQLTESSMIAGWGIMHARLAITAWLWTYRTDNFLKLKEKTCHKDSNTPSLIVAGSCGCCRVRALDFLTMWFPQKQLRSQVIRSSQDRGTLNWQRPPPDTLGGPKWGLGGRHGLRSLKQRNQRR